MKPVLNGNVCRYIGIAGCLLAIIQMVVLFLDPASAYRELQHINCISNLKQIGIAFLLWKGDHGDQYPWNVSTNAGGTMELCARDKDGFDSNTALHLKVMSNELVIPQILVCPRDNSKTFSTNFGSMRAENVSYRFRSGPSVTESNATEILATCPFHGNLLFCDGSVASGRPAPPPGFWDELNNRWRGDQDFQVRLVSDSIILAAGVMLFLMGKILKTKSNG
jgi:prepilin-type processing-associated H-X9-DG protein